MSVSSFHLPVVQYVLMLIGWMCLSLAGVSWAQSERQAVVLLTDEEAARLGLTEEQFEWQVEYERGTLSPSHDETDQRGPRIEIQSPVISDPPVVRATTPFALSIAFRRNSAPVDMQSLKVSVRKLGVWFDITARLGCSVESNGGNGDSGCRVESDEDGGWQIAAYGVEIPRGRFAIEIHIADDNSEPTVQRYYFRVRRG